MLGLGIDTGGTYTDAVIYDFATETVISRAKSPTTKDDLSRGIIGAVRGVDAGLAKQVTMCSLSTTLATNACVEGKGGRAALLLMGYDPNLFARLMGEYGLAGVEAFHVPGSHGQRGEVLEQPDFDALRTLIGDIRDRFDALGIVEYWGMRNPEFEIAARDAVREVCELPIAVCHELTGELNSLKRAATTALNARLIPLTARLIGAVSSALRAMGIDAPLMIVRGDGSLMTQAFARERPVETLLSGPAASVVGGMHLSGEADAVIADIGGTTTDIALVRGGRAVSSNHGVDVGDWRTGTRALLVRTIGLGGDSRLTFDNFGKLTIGLRRALPLSALAHDYPGVTDALREMSLQDEHKSYSRGEFFIKTGESSGILNDKELAIIDALSEGPLSIEALCVRVGEKPYFIDLARLEFLGLIQRAALTPTDIMHINGDFTPYDRQAAQYGLSLLAARLQTSTEKLAGSIYNTFAERLFRVVADLLLYRRNGVPPEDQRLMSNAFAGGGEEVAVTVSTTMPLIGIGAPTHVFVHRAAEALRTRAIVPADAPVAGAVGAIKGAVAAEARVVIRPRFEVYGIDGYNCHSSSGLARFDTLDEAIFWAEETAVHEAAALAERMGAPQAEVRIGRHASEATPAGEDAQPMLLEMVIEALAMGKAGG